MEPLACTACGTPISMKYPLYLDMYKNVQNKTQELWDKTIDTLEIRNACCKMKFQSIMVRKDMIERSTEVKTDPIVLQIIDEYEKLMNNKKKSPQ